MQIKFSVDNIIALLHQTNETCRIEKYMTSDNFRRHSWFCTPCKSAFSISLRILFETMSCQDHLGMKWCLKFERICWFCYFWMCRNRMRHRKFYVNAFRMSFNKRKFRNIRNIQTHWAYWSNLLRFRRWNTQCRRSHQTRHDNLFNQKIINYQNLQSSNARRFAFIIHSKWLKLLSLCSIVKFDSIDLKRRQMHANTSSLSQLNALRDPHWIVCCSLSKHKINMHLIKWAVPNETDSSSAKAIQKSMRSWNKTQKNIYFKIV